MTNLQYVVIHSKIHYPKVSMRDGITLFKNQIAKLIGKQDENFKVLFAPNQNSQRPLLVTVSLVLGDCYFRAKKLFSQTS